ncbi:hypothetical protein NM208_g8490 [Fusarium decemcellulare]|uniref:Uncharacterized protein n=1 Tax=Fusarium decemcellulare TaxID=57161 RepID=A0ACC1S542_9HYPO|nr:hypothetical protein NM208_g8490 [Fusarium decemcellulare]
MRLAISLIFNPDREPGPRLGLRSSLEEVVNISLFTSILSPADPEADELSNASSNQSTPKRKFEEVSSAPQAAPSVPHRTGIPVGQSGPDVGGVEPSGGHAEEHRVMLHSGYRDGKKAPKMRQPMRSSIACLRCRRSKIKCDNDGGNSPCDTCIKGGHQCQYPEATTLPPKRNDPPATGKQDKDGPHERKKAKRMEEPLGLDNEKSTAYAEEILAYPFLTLELWDQLFGIYKQHYTTELSFIHLPTLKEKTSYRQGQSQGQSSELNLILLGVLMLTARFHPDLVKYVTHLSGSQNTSVRPRTLQSKSDPLAASEFFAHALTIALGPLRTAMTVITVERVQAFLMLGLFEWSQRDSLHGLGAWMYVGVAIRMAKLLKLGLDDQLVQSQLNRTLPPRETRVVSSQIGIIRESRRRTMYSCLVLDRMMASGHERAASIPVESIHIQLPCSEMAFDLSLDVYTGFLRPPEELSSRYINDDSTLSRFIQLVEIWVDISKYSSAGGRSLEALPPRNNESTFHGLREKLDRFYMELPDTFTLSRQNYYRHDNHQATSTYVSLHLLASVCQIVLGRECLPFLPVRCTGPQCPVGSSWTTHDQVATQFREGSADTVFRAARDILDLIEICKDKLPLSSLAVFAVWQAGFMALYAHHFPLMDVQQRITVPTTMDQHLRNLGVFEGAGAGTAYQALNKAGAYLPGAQNYLAYLEELNQYFTQARNQFHQQAIANDPTPEPLFEDRRLSIRLGGDNSNETEESRAESQREALSPSLDDERRSQLDEESDRSRNSSCDPLRSTGPPEGHGQRSDYAQGHSISSATPFEAAGSLASLRSGLVGSPPHASQSRREGLSLKGTRLEESAKLAASTSKSQLLLPGIDEAFPEKRLPEFSTERLEIIEWLRIGKVLNDLEEFSGAGSLGAGSS